MPITLVEMARVSAPRQKHGVLQFMEMYPDAFPRLAEREAAAARQRAREAARPWWQKLGRRARAWYRQQGLYVHRGQCPDAEGWD